MSIIGYNSIGSLTANNTSHGYYLDTNASDFYTCAGTGYYVSDFNVFCKSNGANVISCGLYDMSTSGFVASTSANVNISTTDQWYSITGLNIALTSGITYSICLHSSLGGSSFQFAKETFGTFTWNSLYQSDWPSPIGGIANETGSLSMYATVQGGSGPSKNPTQLIIGKMIGIW